jgi:hypothetical protein
MPDESVQKGRQLMDQWVGDWNVVDTFADGRIATGSYTVRKALADQVIIGDYESTQAGRHFEGHWVRAFDPSSGKWKYWWFDTLMPGGVETGEGDVSDAGFVLEGARPGGERIRITERWSGRSEVTQTIEADRGQGFKPTMTIVYTRAS